MARLQDFQNVTPSGSDKFLIVQAQGQGLATIDSVVNKSKTEITSQVTFTENISGTNTRFYYKNGILYIFYQGESKAHAQGDNLFTLPSGYRPTNQLYIPFIINNTAFGNLSFGTSGNVSINQISSGSTTGRIYFSCAIPIV